MSTNSFKQKLTVLAVILFIGLHFMAAQIYAAAPYEFSMDSFQVAGNLPGNLKDNFDDGILDPWNLIDPTVVEFGGVITFSSPGSIESGLWDGIHLLNEVSYIGQGHMSPYLVANGAGDFTGTSSWKPVVPKLNQYYQMQIDYVLNSDPRESIDISLGVSNRSTSIAGAFGVSAGLSIMFTRGGAIPSNDHIFQSFPITEADITGDIILRMTFHDNTDQFTADFSLDGGLTFQSPFVPIKWGMDTPGTYEWLFAGGSLEVQTYNVYTYFIDEFSVTKNGKLMFQDSFDDGIPPPGAPNYSNGNQAAYFMRGTMGPETGGKLVIDSSGAATANIFNTLKGAPLLFQRARLNTNIDESDLSRGLKIDDTFSVTGIFDLIVPTFPRDAYGVRLSDFTSTYVGNSVVELVVRHTGYNNLRIQFRAIDFVLGTVTTVKSVPLETTHDQIWLNLRRDNLSSNAITASIAYFDGGVMGPVMTYLNTIDIFNGENYTTAEFIARSIKHISMTIPLHKGFNFISAPTNTYYIYDAFSLLAFMVKSGDNIDKIGRYDRITGTVQWAYYQQDGGFEGDSFSIVAGEGLIVYAKDNMDIVLSQNICPTFDLNNGLNWVGTPCLSGYPTVSSLLHAIGSDHALSIQHFNTKTGHFETASYINGDINGVNFPINAGEGYFIYMIKDKFGFQLTPDP